MKNDLRGKLIQKEKLRLYKRDRRDSIGITILCFVGACIFIGFFAYEFVAEILSNDFRNWDIPIFLIAVITLFIGGLYLGYRPYLTRTQIEVYENGFIPARRSYRYAKEGKQLFVSWDEVTEMKRKNFLENPDKWFYTIKISRKEKPSVFALGHTLFDNDGMDVLKKLEDVERKLSR